jgi:hypothetical protein
MKITADQLLQIAGIAPTTALRTRLNESTTSRSSANAEVTKQAKAAAEKAGKKFGTDAEYRLWYAMSTEGTKATQKAAKKKGGSVNESDEGGGITSSVEYTWRPRYNSVSAEAQHPDGSTSYVTLDEPFKFALRHGDISADHMSRTVFDNIQAVMEFMTQAAAGDYEEAEEAYEGDEDALIDSARGEHTRLFGTDVKATFNVDHNS